MKSMLDEGSRTEIISRLERLQPEMTPLWGKMTAPEMVAHLYDTTRSAFGEIAVPFKPNFLSTRFGRWLSISAPIAWPKGKIQAMPQFLVTKPSPSFDADRSRVVELLRRFERGEQQPWGTSESFGALPPHLWGQLTYRHTDHHLRQFGL